MGTQDQQDAFRILSILPIHVNFSINEGPFMLA